MLRAVLLTLIVLLSSRARAEAPAVRGNVHAGLGTPLGYLGVAGEALPFSWLAVELGVGKGFYGDWFQDASTRWLNKSAHASARLALDTGAVVAVGGGVSVGPFGEGDTIPLPGHECDPDCTGLRYQAVWVNADASVEWRIRSGHSARAYAGVAHMVRGGPELEGTYWPYVGVAITVGELGL